MTVPAECSGFRLDQALARILPEHSRSRLQAWIREGRVRVESREVPDPSARVWGGEALTVLAAPEPEARADLPEAIPLRVVFEDRAILVLDKPAGLVTHPGSGNRTGTLLNALLHHDSGLEKVPRAGLVHRLDKNTSGLMVVAKTPEAHTALVRQLQHRTVRRVYLALVHGRVEGDGSIDAPIGRHSTQRTRMAVVASGREARTHYRVVRRCGRVTLLECALETGRTHQIRVHLASLGHPLVGDPEYGRKRVAPELSFARQALHAWRLALQHPVSGRTMRWESPLPPDLAELIARLCPENVIEP